MLPLKNQVYIATDGAKGCGAGWPGWRSPNIEDAETTFPELKARVAKTIAFLKSLDRKAFAGAENKDIVLKFPNATLEFNGADYVGNFVLPNVYFHITTAYGILRNQGVALGKARLSGGVSHGLTPARFPYRPVRVRTSSERNEGGCSRRAQRMRSISFVLILYPL